MSFDALNTIATFLGSAGGYGWLAAGGVIAVLLTAAAVALMWRRARRLRAGQDALDAVQDVHTRVGHQSYDPAAEDGTDRLLADLDRMEDTWRRQQERDR